MALCIFHNDHNASMQVNRETGLFLCFSCGASGGPQTLYRELGLDFSGVENDLSGVIRQLEEIDRQQSSRREPVKIGYPESYLQQFDMDTNYWSLRDIGPEMVKKFKLGYDILGDYMTIPMRDMNGTLLGVTKRYRNIEDSPTGDRYKYPAGFQRKENLYASWLIAQDDGATTVALTEGALDTIKVWQAGHPSCAVYGNSLSTHQVRLLVRLGVQRVILFPDNDAGGRALAQSCVGIRTNRRKGKKIERYDPATDLRQHFEVSRVVWPQDSPYPSVTDEDEDAGDPGDLSSEAIEEMLQCAVPVD